jgi:hypothetical protein
MPNALSHAILRETNERCVGLAPSISPGIHHLVVDQLTLIVWLKDFYQQYNYITCHELNLNSNIKS